MSQQNEFQQVGKGIAILFGMHIVGANLFPIAIFLLEGICLLLRPIVSVSILQVISPLPYNFLIFISICQLFYVIPLVRRFERRQQFGLMKGVLLGATLTAILNGGCWVIYALSQS